MSAAKKRAGSTPLVGAVRHILQPLAGRSRMVFVLVSLGILPIVGFYLAWAKWGSVVTNQPRYVLDANSLEITPQPSWIHADVKTEVIRDGRLAGMSILDPELTRRVVRAFELHTWVAKVDWVGKRPGKDAPRVIVRLRYREPAIMVKTKQGYQGFWPVDTNGVLLPPNEFSPSQTHSYLRVLAGESLPAGPVGTPFGDEGVLGAAKIAAAFRETWRQIGLEWIQVVNNRSHDLSQPNEPTYLLLPSGTPPHDTQHQWAGSTSQSTPSLEIRWGRAPGREQRGEATAAEKVARLKQFSVENGPLDKQSGSLILDLRPATGISIITSEPPARQ